MESQQYKTVERIETIPPATTAASKREQEQQLINNITISNNNNNNNKNNNKNNNNNKEPNNMSEEKQTGRHCILHCPCPKSHHSDKSEAQYPSANGRGPFCHLSVWPWANPSAWNRHDFGIKVCTPQNPKSDILCLSSKMSQIIMGISWEYHGISWIIGVLMRTVLISISSLRVPWVPRISIQSLTDHIWPPKPSLGRSTLRASKIPNAAASPRTRPSQSWIARSCYIKS